eukprot:gene3795-4190_t
MLDSGFKPFAPGQRPSLNLLAPLVPPIDGPSPRTVRYGVVVCDDEGNLMTIWASDPTDIVSPVITLDAASTELCKLVQDEVSLTGTLSNPTAVTVADTLPRLTDQQVSATAASRECWATMTLE